MSEPCRVITEEQYQDYLRSKEQLKEANCIVKMFARYGWSGNQEEDEITRYLEKWGVK